MKVLEYPTVALPVIALLGACIGSFLNVLIYRLPRRENIAYPASHCPSCGNTIKYIDNIPIISYLFLKGRCRDCSEKISARYPIIELLTAIMFVTIYMLQGWSIQFLADVTLGSIFLTAAVIDYEYMIIPDRLTFSGVFMGLLYSLYFGWKGLLGGFHGILVSLLILSFMYYLGKILYRKDGIGFGDVKLALVFGLFFGVYWSIVTIAIAVLVGALSGITLMLVRGREKGLEIPFGPFLAFGGFMVIFFRPQLLYLINLYLSQFS